MAMPGLSVSRFFRELALHKFILVLLLRYITAMTTVTLPVFAFSIAFRSPLMVSVAVLVTLIGRGSVDVKLKPKGSFNLGPLSTCNPVSLYPISYLLSESLLKLLREHFLRSFFAAFLSPFFTSDSMASMRKAICFSVPPPSFLYVGLLPGGCYSLSIVVVLATLLVIVGRVGPTAVLAMLAELCRFSFLWDSLA